MSELSGVAKLLQHEGCYGWSLARKIETLIAERNGHRARCDELRLKVNTLTKIIDAQRAAINEWQGEDNEK